MLRKLDDVSKRARRRAYCFSSLRVKNKLRKSSTDRGERERLKKEIRHLRKDIRVYEEKASQEAMQSVNVILCTLTSATDDGPLRLLPPNHFDLVVIDECSQVQNPLRRNFLFEHDDPFLSA